MFFQYHSMVKFFDSWKITFFIFDLFNTQDLNLPIQDQLLDLALFKSVVFFIFYPLQFDLLL